MKIIIISFLLLVMANPFKSQSFHDVVEIGGYQYMISPSPSLYYFESDQYDYFFTANYYIMDGQIFMDEMTSLNRKIKSNEFKDTIWEMEYYGQPVLLNDDYKLVKLPDSYKAEQMLLKTGIHLNEYSARGINVSFNEGEITYPFSFDMESGNLGLLELNVPEYEINDFKVFNATGEIMYSYADYDTEYFDGYNYSLYLPAGEYKVEIIYNEFIKIYEGVTVSDGSTTNMYIGDGYYEVQEDECYECAGVNLTKFNSNFSLLYGNNQLYQDEASEVNSFTFRTQQGEEFMIGNSSVFSVLPFGGAAYSLNVGHADSSLINGMRVKHQYYSYFIATAGVAARLYLNKYKNSNDARPYLEIGTYYNLPIVFRQISRVDNYKRSERWISRYNDVQVYGKLGITNRIGLQGSYRLFDVVKNNYPQLPKLQVGLTVDINY